MQNRKKRLSFSFIRIFIETIVAILVATMVVLACNLLAYAEEDDLNWNAGAVASEAYSQPYEAQCAISRIVWEEARRRNISVKKLATETSYLSGWQHGGEWHRAQYLNPEERFKVIAKNGAEMLCTNWNAKWFDGKYTVVSISFNGEESGLIVVSTTVSKQCLTHPKWSKVVTLLKEIAGSCFYGYLPSQ